ncbi:MAG: hypothetical protein GYA17_04420 [Chloroflexi bacterium]|nr:hypothetical protein [Chloroflexota bacterium]
MKRRWAWIAWLGLGLWVALMPLPSAWGAPVERFYRLEASQFEFTPAVLRANPGDRVTIELVSTDVVHGLSIDGYDFQLTADPGQAARVSFVAGRPGSFYLRCATACGSLHPFMLGRFEVGGNPLLLRAGLLSGLVVLAAWFQVRS